MGTFRRMARGSNVTNGGRRIVAVTEYPEYNTAAVIYADDSREEMPLDVFRTLELL